MVRLSGVCQREGCNLICAARDRQKLLSVRRHVEAIGQECLIYEFDALERNSVMQLSETLHKKSQSPDTLVNNGGGGGRLGESSVIDSSEKVWGEVLQKNYQCCLDLTLYFLPTMQKREWGRIVTVTSIYGLMDGGRPWFNVAKVAQTTLMKNLAMKAEFASKNITFNSVAPGALMIPDTGWEEFQLNQPEQFKKMIETKHPQKRLGTAEEVASAITFICSYKASYLNGASILLDGEESGII